MDSSWRLVKDCKGRQDKQAKDYRGEEHFFYIHH
jgi:hypothetical protein